MRLSTEREGITFDDILLVPQRSSVVPRDVDATTNLTKNIPMNIPIVSAAMDTVTGSALAIAMAQQGGVGIIHRNMTPDAQAQEVRKVKRYESGIIADPITLPPDETLATAKKMMEKYQISGLPIVSDRGKLVGILTVRDLRFQKDLTPKISEAMTTKLITAPAGTTLDEAKDILHRSRIEKLLLVDDDFRLRGLITIKDISKAVQYPHACKDSRGRLRVGAAVGVSDMERVKALVDSEVDVICVDAAHGHSEGVLKTVEEIKKKFDVELIAGNVVTARGTEDLMTAGVDAVKVGVGPGSICTTRVIAGVGVPQVTAILDCVEAASKKDIPIIADGGIRQSGDITKAIACGAHSVMIGRLLSGVDESPGEIEIFEGRGFKSYRGMGSLGAMGEGSRDRYGQHAVKERDKLVPEGVEGRVPYKGKLADFVYQLVGGLRSGMGYCGLRTIEELRTKAQAIRISGAGLTESHPHSIFITKEAPNYRAELG